MAKQWNDSHADLFSQIDQWETNTIAKVQQTAKQVRHQLIQLIQQEKETLAEEIRNCQVEDDLTDDELERLRQKNKRLQLVLAQLTRPNRAKVILVKNEQIDWDHVIYATKQEGE